MVDMKDINPLLKLIIAVLLLLCLIDMPYGFYELVRFAAAAAFVYMAYGYFKVKRDGMGFLFSALAILFQPFFKISLGRMLWNVIDVAVAIALVYLLIKTFKKK